MNTKTKIVSKQLVFLALAIATFAVSCSYFDCKTCKSETDQVLEAQQKILEIQNKQIKVITNNEKICENQKFLQGSKEECEPCKEKEKTKCEPEKQQVEKKYVKEVKPKPSKPKVEPKSRKEEKKTNRSKKTETKVDCDTCLKYPAPKPKKECNPCGVLKTKYFNGVEYEEYTGWNPETKKYRTQDESPVDASGNTKDGFYYGDNKWWLKKN